MTDSGQSPAPVDHPVAKFVPVGTPVDLDNCAREPIHIPGSIQPRGVLVVVREHDFTVRQVSANVLDQLGRSVNTILGGPLSALIGTDQAARVEAVAATTSDLDHCDPLQCVIVVGGEPRAFEAILNRAAAGVLLVELEFAYGERPFAFPNTYQAVRHSVEAFNRAGTLSELFETTARAVRYLTGFDRVMVYRYDEDYNGEVVAECKRADLNSFLGLHYPSTDIPLQARALYEKNRLRLISDVDYTPAPLVPAIDPETGVPLDLTHATLRSVSPIHVEYLQNMGVRASMSISLLRHGRLWGLIACHHYAGPYLPPLGTRAAAELLGATLSVHLVDRFEEEQLHRRLAAQAVLGRLAVSVMEEDKPLSAALLGTAELFDLVPADGVVVNTQGDYRVQGSVPSPQTVSAVAAWARRAGEGIAGTNYLLGELPTLDLDPQMAAGALVLNLPEGQYVAWFRREVLRSVDWGGDPHNKAIAVSEGDTIRVSPRKSFERWREIVEQHSQQWTQSQTECAEALRRHLVESLYSRTRGALRVAEMVQRSLLPQSIPTLQNWQLSAHYQPAAGDNVGGDWYDAFELPDGRLIMLIGDVAGHGINAAGTMAQMRNALRAQLFTGASPAEALQQLNEFSQHMLPGAFATVVVARVDLGSGRVEAACAGHLIPYLTDRAGSTVVPAPICLSTPIRIRGASYPPSTFTLEPGQGLVMFSDGLVERRGEALDDGLQRLAQTLNQAVDAPASWIGTAMAPGNTDDDVTVIALHRP